MASAVGVAIVGGTLGMAMTGGGRPGGDAGPRVNIALFTPPDRPAPAAGSVMDVGPLVDGYEHHPIVQPAAAWDEPGATAYLPEDDEPIYDPPVRHWRSDPGPPPEPVEVTDAVPEGRPLSFGFDRRLPDFVAARRARRAAMEAEAEADADAESGPESPARAPERIDPRAIRSSDMFY